MNRETIRFNNVADVLKAKESLLYESDNMWKNVINARFTWYDMTDYETQFASMAEMGELDEAPLQDPGKTTWLHAEPWPETYCLPELVEPETFPHSTTGRTRRELAEARAAEAEEEEEDDDEDEDDEDEDEEGEGDEEGDGEGDEDGDGEDDEDEDEEEGEDRDSIPPGIEAHPEYDDSYFMHNEKLHDKYNEVELDSFMKLLNIKPVVQWQDRTDFHHKLGVRTYEDEG